MPPQEPFQLLVAGIYGYSLVAVVEDQSRPARGVAPQVAHLGVVHGHGGELPAAAVVGCQQCRLLDIALRDRSPGALDDDVASRQALRMQPGVAAGS